MKLHKSASIALTATLVISLLASCGGNGASSTTSSSAPSGGSSSASSASSGASGDSSKSYKISFVAPVNGPVDNNSDLQQYMNTLVPGLEVELVPLEIGSYFDLLNPRMASGEIPDVFHCHNETMYGNYMTQNVLGGVTPDTIKANMPKFVEASKAYGTNVWSLVLKDSKIYGVPAMDESQTRPFTNAWRGDWLKAVGIEKAPETLEEYEDALTKFTFNDPDGDGQNNTYGTTLRGKDATPNLFTSVFGAYGIFPGMWNMTADGSLKFGITDPRAKDALATLNSWFKKGIIDPEFTAVDGTARTEKWANSQIGMLSDSTYYEINPGKAAYENLIALSPDAEIVRGPAPKGPNGDYGYMNWSKLTNKVVFGTPLTAEEGKAEKFLELFEKICTDADTYNQVRYGIEGENWARQDDGSIANIAPYNDAANCGKIGINMFNQGGLMPTPAVKAQLTATNEAEQYKYAIDGTMKNGENYFSYLGKFVSPEVDTAYNVDASDLYKKNLIDFITGARPLSEYEAFIAEWNAAGGEAYTKAYNEVYKNVDTSMKAADEFFN